MSVALTTDNIKTVSQLTACDVAVDADCKIICGKGNKLMTMDYLQLKNNVGKTNKVYNGTSANRTLGEFWYETEITANNVTKRETSNGLIDTTKQGQAVTVNGCVYYLNASGKAYKLDLSTGVTTAMYETITFDFLIKNREFNILVFKASTYDTTKCINYLTMEEVTMKDNEVLKQNWYEVVPYKINNADDVGWWIVNDTVGMMARGFTFKVADGKYGIDYFTDAFNYSDVTSVDDMTIPQYQYGNGTIFAIKNGSLYGYDDPRVTGFDSLNYFGVINATTSSAVYISQKTSTQFFVIDNTLGQIVETITAYSDSNISSTIIDIASCGTTLYVLQSAISGGLAVVKYTWSGTQVVGEVVSYVATAESFTETYLSIDPVQVQAVADGMALNPRLEVFGNDNNLVIDTNFVVDDISYDYESILKIKMPEGIKEVNLI